MVALVSINILLLTAVAYATPPSLTTVTVTMTDSTGQLWKGAYWQTDFVPPFNNPQTPNNNGNPVTGTQSGLADNTATFTVILDDNNVVAPAKSQWRFTLCPNATVGSCSTVNLTVTGSSENLSSQISAILIVPAVNASTTPSRAYKDAEVSGGFGSLYVNTLDGTLRQCSLSLCLGTGWTVISVSTNNPVFTGTLTVPCVKFDFNASNDVTVCSQNGSGHISTFLGTTAGTLVSSAASPLSIDPVTGIISCPSCGGASFPLFAPDGTVGAPSYSWSSNHTSGLFKYTSSPPHGSEDYCFSVNGFCTLEIFNGGTFSNGTLGSTGDITTNNAVNGGTGNFNTGNIFALSVSGSTSIAPILNLQSNIHSTASNYLADGNEVSTPGTPAASTERAYFKAGSGLCAIDSAAVERCTFAGNPGAAILAITTTTSLTNTTVPNSNTTVITHTVTMPSSGCPCRVKADWWLYLSVTGSGQDVAYVDDGTAGFAGNETATPGSASGFGLNGSGFSTITYANNASVTFNLVAAGSHSGSTTVHTGQQGTSITGSPASSLVLAVIPSN